MPSIWVIFYHVFEVFQDFSFAFLLWQKDKDALGMMLIINTIIVNL